MRVVKMLSFAILLISLTVFEADAAEKTLPLTVEWKNDLLTVKAENVPIHIILDEVSRRTGFLIYGPKNLQDPQTVFLSNSPLDQALHVILKPSSYFIISVSSVQGSTSSVILVNKKDESNSKIVSTLISMYSGPYQTDALKKAGSGTEINNINTLKKPAALDPEHAVAWKNEPLTIGARNVPLNVILGMISQQAGISIYGAENLQEPKTVQFDSLSLDQILRNLLKSVNYIMIQISAAPEESFTPLILLSKNDDVNNDILNTLISKVTTLYETKALKEETEDSDNAKRYRAFEKLAEMDSEEDEGILIVQEQLHNPRPEVRMTALQTMAYGIDSERGLEAAKEAMKDSDDQVRSIARGIYEDLRGDESAPEGGDGKAEP